MLLWSTHIGMAGYLIRSKHLSYPKVYMAFLSVMDNRLYTRLHLLIYTHLFKATAICFSCKILSTRNIFQQSPTLKCVHRLQKQPREYHQLRPSSCPCCTDSSQGIQTSDEWSSSTIAVKINFKVSNTFLS